jgi:hypothetical protein
MTLAIPHDPDLIHRFRQQQCLSGTGPGGGFAYQLDFSLPYLVTAIHAGHRMRDELRPLAELDEEDRRFEEDAATDAIIRGVGSTIWGLDSRAEYDLNRPETTALPLTPEQFWGLQVYRKPPGEEMNRRSLAKHAAFYRFVGSCLKILLEKHGACVVYDIHSYNISRQKQKGFTDPPVFNLGTALLDRNKWGTAIDAWLDALRGIRIPGHRVSVAENLVFQGKAELCRRITQWSNDILVLPTEIAKIYMDEHTGRLFADVIEALNGGLQTAVTRHIGFWPFL